MENEISERLKIWPKVIQLLSQGSSLGPLPLLPLFPTAREVQSTLRKPDFFWGGGMSKQLAIPGKSQTLMRSKLGLEKQVGFEFMEIGEWWLFPAQQRTWEKSVASWKLGQCKERVVISGDSQIPRNQPTGGIPPHHQWWTREAPQTALPSSNREVQRPTRNTLATVPNVSEGAIEGVLKLSKENEL